MIAVRPLAISTFAVGAVAIAVGAVAIRTVAVNTSAIGAVDERPGRAGTARIAQCNLDCMEKCRTRSTPGPSMAFWRASVR